MPTRHLVARLLLLFALLSAARTVLQAQAPQPFVGTWVEDQSKRTLGSERSLTFRRAADGGIEEHRGSYARPLVQPVRFGTAPYAVDGSRNTLTWRELGPRQFERTIAQNGRTINTRRIQISADDNTLTEATDSSGTDGRTTTVTTTFRRTSGQGQGLVGVWTPQSRHATSPAVLRIEAANNGLRVTANPDRSGFTTYVLTFDGRVAPVSGPAVISGTATVGKQLDARTIEQQQSREGVATGMLTWALSPEGKTLTARSVNVGPGAGKEPSIAVYIKQ